MATHIYIETGVTDMKTTVEISQPLLFQASPVAYQYKNLSVDGSGLSSDFDKLSPLEQREFANDRDA